jgi:hypothetical protein
MNETNDLIKNLISFYQETGNAFVPYYIKLLTGLLSPIIMTLAVGGNLLVIVIVVKKKNIDQVTNWIEIVLACSDILFVVVCMPPYYIYYIYEYWLLGKVSFNVQYKTIQLVLVNYFIFL